MDPNTAALLIKLGIYLLIFAAIGIIIWLVIRPFVKAFDEARDDGIKQDEIEYQKAALADADDERSDCHQYATEMANKKVFFKQRTYRKIYDECVNGRK